MDLEGLPRLLHAQRVERAPRTHAQCEKKDQFLIKEDTSEFLRGYARCFPYKGFFAHVLRKVVVLGL
jgi:hypothetical protein